MTMPRLWLVLVLLATTAAAVPGCGGAAKLRMSPDGAAGSGAAGRGATGGGAAGSRAAGNGGAGDGTAGSVINGGGAGTRYTGPAAGFDDGTCSGPPIKCVPGQTWEDNATSCDAAAPTPGWCSEGKWGCVPPTVDQSSCTCTEPHPACSSATCTLHGWVCPCGDVNPGCWYVAGSVLGTDLVICAGYDKDATCYSSGAWSCYIGRVPGTMCAHDPWTCSRGVPHDQHCACSPNTPPDCAICWGQDWNCTEGGVDGSADAPGDGGADGASGG